MTTRYSNDYTVEDEINDRLSFKYFLGLPVHVKGPDHSPLFKFCDRLGPERFSRIFNQVVEIARAHKLVSNKLYIVDSTQVKAKVDLFRITAETKQTQDTSDKNPTANDGGGFSTPDPDAKFGRKSNHQMSYGYKEHLCLDARKAKSSWAERRRQAMNQKAIIFQRLFLSNQSVGAGMVLGGSLVMLQSGEMEKMSEAREKLGTFSATDACGTIAVAKRVHDNIAFGGSVKIINQKIDDESATGLAMDIGYKAGKDNELGGLAGLSVGD